MSDIPPSAHIPSIKNSVIADERAEQKKAVRSALRARRRERSPQTRAELSQSLTKHALNAEFLYAARVVASFDPLATEPDITTLNNALAARGIDVLIPVMLPDKDLTWRPLASDDDLGTDAIARADVILTPALALGPGGERLGQGGGSYDRALPRRKRDALIVGVVFAEDLHQNFPCENHDQTVHLSLTEDGLLSYKTPSDG